MSRAPSPSPAPTLVDTRTPSLASDSHKHAKLASTSSNSPSSLTKPLPPAAPLDAEKGALAEAPYAGAGTAADPFVVKFSEGDPANPFNFSPAKRWTLVAIAAVATLCKCSSWLRRTGYKVWAAARAMRVDSGGPGQGRVRSGGLRKWGPTSIARAR